jgi:hypothetical protein
MCSENVRPSECGCAEDDFYQAGVDSRGNALQAV